jgi:hypothetical protein
MVLDSSMLLEADIASWPRCDVLIGFDAKGCAACLGGLAGLASSLSYTDHNPLRYPLEKVIAYKNRVKPNVINDLDTQLLLRDRRNTFASCV